MPDQPQQQIPRVLAAMSALDDADAAYQLVAERLAAAVAEAEHLDEQLRRIPFENQAAQLQAAQRFVVALALMQRLSWREAKLRQDRARAQVALDLVRRADHRAHAERLRIELEIDAASIWDAVGRFEEQLRARLEQHAAVAAELELSANAAGEQRPRLTAWAPAMGAAGPALWKALAEGIRPPEAVERSIETAPLPPRRRSLIQPPVHPVAPEPPQPIEIPPSLQTPFPPDPRPATRIRRVLKTLARIVDSDEPKPSKKTGRP